MSFFEAIHLVHNLAWTFRERYGWEMIAERKRESTRSFTINSSHAAWTTGATFCPNLMMITDITLSPKFRGKRGS